MDNNVSFQLMEIRTTFTPCHDASRQCKSKIKEGEVYNNTFLESLRPEKLFALFSIDNRSTRIELYRVSKNMFPQCFIRLKKKNIQKKNQGYKKVAKNQLKITNMNHNQVQNLKIGSLHQNSGYKGVKEKNQVYKKQL